MTGDDAMTFSCRMLKAAYGGNEADDKLIESACENIFLMRKAQGMSEAFEAMRRDVLPEEEK